MLEYGMEPYVSLSTAAFIPLTQAGFIFGVSLLVSIYPAWHMRRFDTLKAMRG
jgi:hypothetical protein